MRGPNIKKTTQARELRRNATSAENKLWAELRNRQLDGIKFARQVVIGPFIADFACRSSKLVVEIDGVTHQTAEEKQRDQARTLYLNEQGYCVIRFTNEDMFGDLGPVLDEIRRHLA
jgi:very-short-patch-repair endonuclease